MSDLSTGRESYSETYYCPILGKDDYKKFIKTYKFHFDNLQMIVESTGEQIEGNIYCDTLFNTELDFLKAKQINLISICIYASRIMEIGFNAGHSALLMLLANPGSTIVCFDICEHEYTKHCFEYLHSQFPDRIELHPGNSNIAVNAYEGEPFDLCHIDGCHNPHVANIDFHNTMTLTKEGTIVIFDDTNHNDLMELWKSYLHSNLVHEIKMPHVNIPMPWCGSRTAHSFGIVKAKPVVEAVPVNITNEPVVESVGEPAAVIIDDVTIHDATNLKIAVISTAITQSHKNAIISGQQGKRAYCKSHGYTFFDDADIYDGTHKHQWVQLKVLKKYLKHPLNYDYVVWLGPDSCIKNHTIALEDIIADNTDNKDITLCRDWKRVGTDVMIIKNTPWTHQYLETTCDLLIEGKGDIVSSVAKNSDNIHVMSLKEQGVCYSQEVNFIEGNFIMRFPEAWANGDLAQKLGQHA